MMEVDSPDTDAARPVRSPQLIWAADSRGGVTSVNAQWTEYTGLPAGALLGSGWISAVEPGQRDAALAAWFAGVAQQTTVVEQPIELRRSDGSYGWFARRAVPIVDAAGEITQWIATHTDVDDRVRLGQVLSAGAERYRSILETTQEGVWVVDAQARTRYVNRRFAEMLGYEPRELLGVPAFDLFDASERPQIAEQFARRRAGEITTQEYRFRRRDGRHVFTITAANPIVDDAGTFIGSIGMVTDITERKAMEDRLATIAAEYQSLTEATPQIVWSAGPRGAFDYVNSRWSEYTGITRADAEKWGWIPAVHRHDVAALLVAWRTALDAGSELEAALRLRRNSDGSSAGT